jgi:hypothetical protein
LGRGGVSDLECFENPTLLLKRRLELGWVGYAYEGSLTGEELQGTQFLEWMLINVGTMVPVDDWSTENSHAWDILWDQLIFRDPDKAVMAKLVWGDVRDIY